MKHCTGINAETNMPLCVRKTEFTISVAAHCWTQEKYILHHFTSSFLEKSVYVERTQNFS